MNHFHDPSDELPEAEYAPEQAKYCHVCQREIIPIREWDLQATEWVYIYVHDEKPHTNIDLQMFDTGVQ